ncbi:MAG: hypothetical protein GXY82_10005 [Methanospirillum sp.]|nr:hypothetical protein [Methanospirillum sp.]
MAVDRVRVAAVGLVALAAAGVWLVPGLDPLLGAVVLLLGGALAWLAWSGHGDRYLLLCTGEAFALGIGLALPVLAVLAQPFLAALAVGTGDRAALVAGGGAATLLAAGFVLAGETLLALLALVAALAAVAVTLAGLEAWAARRLAGGAA